jgi:hypothetical protein
MQSMRMLSQLEMIPMRSISCEVPVNDPLFSRVPLEHDAMFYPHGYPVRIRSNSSFTLEAAHKSWNAYKRRYTETPLDIRLFLSKSDSPGCIELPTFRFQGHLLSIVADRENFASLDLDAGFAFGWATEATAQNQEYFTRYLLDAMIYPLLEVRHVIKLDAAGAVSRR